MLKADIDQLREEPARRSRAVYVLARGDGGWRVESLSISPVERHG